MFANYFIGNIWKIAKNTILKIYSDILIVKKDERGEKKYAILWIKFLACDTLKKKKMCVENIEHMFYIFRRAFSGNLLTETQYIGRWFYGRNKRIRSND